MELDGLVGSPCRFLTEVLAESPAVAGVSGGGSVLSMMSLILLFPGHLSLHSNLAGNEI